MTATPRFPPVVLREYAFLGDGRRGALIGPRGDIGWLCVPNWESDAVFASLLGGGGVYAVTPADPRYVWGGSYRTGTLIWTSRWVTGDGVVQCREALAYPADPHRAVLLRRVEAVDGDADLDVVLDAGARFGRDPMRDVHHDGPLWTARTGRLYLRWSAGAGVRRDRTGALRLRLRVPAGESHDLVLELSDRPLRHPPPQPHEAWDVTERTWRNAATHLDRCTGERDVVHACTVLRGLTVPGGGMVAAPTTALPERAEEGRNYDYRYAWIRDQCIAGQAAATAGADDLLDAAVTFVADRLCADGPELSPAYVAASGAPVPAERDLPWLPGYPGAPVRVGNRVADQFQLDAFGEALLLFAAADRRDRLDDTAVKAMHAAVHAITRRRREPDAGIWELEPQRWTHSALTCVAGLRAAAATVPASTGGDWVRLADTILADTGRWGVHPSGRWQRTADDPRVDAALLFPPMRGAVPPDDPRTAATLAAVRDELTRDGYVFRYRADDRPVGAAEGAFLLCGFALAMALHDAGDRVGAARWFERNRAACGSPGLFAEEYDTDQRQLRGNLPQAFVHALMLETAVRLTDG